MFRRTQSIRTDPSPTSIGSSHAFAPASVTGQPSVDRPHDLHDPFALGDQRVHDVAGSNLRRWLRRVAVDVDVPAIAELGRHGPGLHEAHRAEPAINPGFVRHWMFSVGLPTFPTQTGQSRVP